MAKAPTAAYTPVSNGEGTSVNTTATSQSTKSRSSKRSKSRDTQNCAGVYLGIFIVCALCSSYALHEFLQPNASVPSDLAPPTSSRPGHVANSTSSGGPLSPPAPEHLWPYIWCLDWTISIVTYICAMTTIYFTAGRGQWTPVMVLSALLNFLSFGILAFTALGMESRTALVVWKVFSAWLNVALAMVMLGSNLGYENCVATYGMDMDQC